MHSRQSTHQKGHIAETSGVTFNDNQAASYDRRVWFYTLGRDKHLRKKILDRAGIHAGECELEGNRPTGMAVHIAARIQAAAEPREVLVSSTVKDLAVGSGLRFADRGEQNLKGVPDPWRLYAVVD